MNCPKCGSVVPQSALFCPVCNEPFSAAYPMPQQGYSSTYPYPQQSAPAQPTAGYPPVNPTYPDYSQQGYSQQAYPQQGYAQQGYQAPYQQSYMPYEQPSYPPGYQQPYVYGEHQRGQSAFLSLLSELPHSFLASFRSPAEALGGMLERNDTLTFPLVLGVTLLLCFLCGMTMSRSFVEIVFSLVSSLTGVSLASSASSMSQGVNYVAGRIAPSVGGILVLCQLLAVIVPGLVLTVYLTVFCKQRFSWPVLFGLMTVPTYPTVVAALLSMLASLVAPWLALICALCAITLSYVQLSAMLGFLTGRTDAQLFPARAACLCLALAITLLSMLLAGGSLMNMVYRNVLNLLANVEALL